MIEINNDIKEQITANGFTIIENVIASAEVQSILDHISQADVNRISFRKSGDLFAIRRFLKEVPGVIELLFKKSLNKIIADCFGHGYVIVKSIFFDKPEKSNWFVPITRT